MKIRPRQSSPKSLSKIVMGLTLTAATALSYSAISRAQDFDDTLEAELDALSSGIPAAPAPSPTPSASNAAPDASDDFANEEPIKDPFADEGESQASDVMPLEESMDPPAKAAPKTAPQKVAPRTEPISEPDFTEPTAPSEPVAPNYAGGELAPASDEPNASFESRLSQIYAQHSEPVSDEKWTEMIGARAAENYSVQTGDTLWDLSQTLFADGFYWSKLWAENPEIQNPHKIAKGQAIRFIGGTESTPPEVLVVKDEPDALTIQTQAAFEKEDVVPAIQEVKEEELLDFDKSTLYSMKDLKEASSVNHAPFYREDVEGKISQAEVESGVVLEQGEIIPRPILPPPSESRRGVLHDIPKSFRETKPTRYDKTVTIRRRSNQAEKIPAAMVSGFIAYENAPEPMGTVDEVDQGDLVASIGQYVYIRGNEPLNIGARYYSVVPRFDVKSPKGGRIGGAYEVGGVVRIIEKSDEKTNMYRAQVVYAVNPVRVGSHILIGDPPRIAVTTTGRRINEELVVAGGSFSDTRHFFGDGATVFLDTQSSSVRVGDVLAVQARRGERKQTVAPDQTTPIGILKVFHVSGKIASAIVVLSTEEVRVGDRTGPNFPRRMPDLRIETPRITQAPTE